MKQAITASIITLNEEKNIKEAVESVKRVCDEVLVIDSLSSDDTVKIAKSLGAKVIMQKYLGDGPQKAVAEKYAKNDWILSLDADERLDDNALEAILKLNLQDSRYDAYSLRRKTYIGDRFIRLWYPDRLVRLYNKNSAGYSKEIGHASVIASSVKKLDVDILHYSYESYSHMLGNIQKFSHRGAKMLYDKGKRASWYDPFTHSFSSFFKKLILKGGMFQGIDGWSVSIISAFNTYCKYIILLEMQGDIKKR